MSICGKRTHTKNTRKQEKLPMLPSSNARELPISTVVETVSEAVENQNEHDSPSPCSRPTQSYSTEGGRTGRCDIMISYHPSDTRLLDRINAYLVERGFSVWHADAGVSDAQNDRLRGKAVLDTKVFLMVVSQASLTHAPCKDEAALAYISGKSIIPLGVQSYQELEPYLDSAMKMLLAKLNWTFFVHEEDWDKRLLEMADSVSEAIAPIALEEEAFISNPDRYETEFDVEYQSMTESRQRLFITLRRCQSVQQSDMLSGTFQGLDFWDIHFTDLESVSLDHFVDIFIQEYGHRITRHVDVSIDDLLLEQQQQQQQQQYHHKKSEMQQGQEFEQDRSMENWYRQLITKDLFRDVKIIDRSTYDAICSARFNRAPPQSPLQPQQPLQNDIFYNRVKEYAIGKRAMLKVFNMDSSVRLVAIQNLGRYQTPEIVAGLKEILNDKDPNIRTVATLALGRCNESPDVSSIVSHLLRMVLDSDRLVRQAACISLGHLQATEAVPTLVDIWRNEPISDVRDAALAALERMEGVEARIAIDMTRKLDREVERLKRQV